MTKYYFLLAIICIFIGTTAAQQKATTEILPFSKSHIATAPYSAATNLPQRVRNLNDNKETSYTHRIDSLIVYMANEINPAIKMNFVYKENKLDCIYSKIWDSSLLKYVIQNLDKYIYDPQNRLDSTYWFYYRGDPPYVNTGYLYHYEYDSAGKINSMATSSWITLLNNWHAISTVYYQYVETKVSSEYEVSSYSNTIDRYTYHYFDTYENDTLAKEYSVSNNVKQLSSKTATKYIYNSSGQVLSCDIIKYKVSSTDSTSQTINLEELTQYDNNGNVNKYCKADYNDSDGSLKSQLFITPTDIDLNYKTAEILGYDKVGIPIQSTNMIKQCTINNKGTIATYKFYYSSLPVNELSNTSARDAVKVLSGNTTGTVQLQMPTEANYTAAIYNAAGSKIKTIRANNSKITISQLAAGVYFYYINSEKATFSGNFIVK